MNDIRCALGWFGLWLMFCIFDEPKKFSTFLTEHGFMEVSKFYWMRIKE